MGQSNAMMEEIQEQKSLLEGLLKKREELCSEFVDLYQKHRFKKVYFVGNGSPYYAGYALSFAAEKFLKAEAEAIPAGIFLNHRNFNISKRYHADEILLVCPAESGHSKGQVDAARQAKKMGISVMSTTLNPTGILARSSDVVLTKPGKHEVAMAATKGQTMAIFMILLNFLEAAYAAGNIDQETYEHYSFACEKVPENIEKSIADTTLWFEKNKSRVLAAEKYFLLGYGANYATVQEAGLKFFECHGKPSIALELEESLHGPFRALGKKDMVFFLGTEACEEKKRMLRLAQAIEPYCENRVMIQKENALEKGDYLFIHSNDVEFVDTIEYLVPLQVLSYLIADSMHIDLSIPLVASLDHAMLPAYEDDK